MSTLGYWLWHLFPGNPIMLRVLAGGSVRTRHLWVRVGYLGSLIGLVLAGLMSGGGLGGSASLTELAISGATVFTWIAYGQVTLICLLAPLFMAGAINEEQSGETFDILLTTPLTNLQIVLGSLLGRLFFILALLASGLPLFSVLLIFGGVPISSVFTAFGVAALAALTVGSVAITLAVLRQGGRKAVYVFMIVVAGYLVASYAVDRLIRVGRQATASSSIVVGAGGTLSESTTPSGGQTTWLTPLHPLLVLESAIDNVNYRPPDPDDLLDRPWPIRFYLSNPLGAFAALTGLISTALILWSGLRVRAVASGEGRWMAWLRRALHLPGLGAEKRRPPRLVWQNPIAWREANARGRGLAAVLGQLIFVCVAVGLGVAVLVAHHTGTLPDFGAGDKLWAFQAWLLTLLLVELAVIVLVAIYMSAGAVSKEREDGTLDLLLTTPITPRYFIWGKLRGLVSFLSMLIAVPVLTLAIVAGYGLVGQLLEKPWAYRPGPYQVRGADAQTDSLIVSRQDEESAPSIRRGDRVMIAGSSGLDGLHEVTEVRGDSGQWRLILATDIKGAAGGGRLTTLRHARPILLPESPVLLLLMLLPFVALAVAVGVHHSLRSKGVMGAVVPSLGILGLMSVVLGFCGLSAAENIPFIGPFINAFSPATALVTLLNPWETLAGFSGNPAEGRVSLLLCALMAAGGYSAIVYALTLHMVRGFDQTIRRLSGTA